MTRMRGISIALRRTWKHSFIPLASMGRMTPCRTCTRSRQVAPVSSPILMERPRYENVQETNGPQDVHVMKVRASTSGSSIPFPKSH